MVLLVHFGCKKNDSAAPVNAYNNMKVYDDTLADIRNESVHIAAGNGLLYMTYGVYNSNNAVSIAMLAYATNNIYYANLQATDYEGNLIWKHKLPTGRVVGDILILDDGTLVTASIQSFDHYYPQPKPYIYLSHFDKSGQKILEDSVILTKPGIKGYNTVHLSHSVNNNLMLSGEVVTSGGGAVPYAGEVDLNLNLLWDKTNYFALYPGNSDQIGGFTKSIKTPDGNYLFVRYYPQNDTGVVVMKINPAGDVIWKKPFTFIWGTTCNDFIQNANGNYQLSITTSTGKGWASRIYEVNANGDSINSINVSAYDSQTNYGLVPKNDGSVFALYHPFPYGWSVGNTYSSVITPNYNYPVFDKAITYFVNIDSQQQPTSSGNFQSKTSDFFRASCKLPSGQIACFGVLQSANKSYYKPALLIFK